MKHKHAEVIRAFIDGKECECWSKSINDWHPHPISSLAAFDFCETVRVKPEPKQKEYYDEDTFDVQYLYAYNDTKNGVMRFISKKIINLIDWEYMGKVRLEK
jgi:hypothetical protein